MACQDRRSARDLIDEISKDAPRFGFFQAVRLLALTAQEQDSPPVPTHLRFGAPLSLGFPASEILDAQTLQTSCGDEAVDDTKRRAAMRLAVGFMGLTGPSGTLPVTYTEALIERRNTHRDTTAHGFLDMFTHRSVSLFYSAWRKHRFHIAYEAGDREGFTRNVLDLVGAGLKSMQTAVQKENGIPDMLLSHFAGLLSQRPVSAANLAAVLRGYLGVDVTVEQYVGQWAIVPDDEQSRLGTDSCVLGETAFAGERLWDRQSKIRVRIGPLDSERFADFLPGLPGAITVARLVEFCVGQTLACDVSLVLRKDCVPSPVLAKSDRGDLRLGYNTWLHSAVPQSHQENVSFSILD